MRDCELFAAAGPNPAMPCAIIFLISAVCSEIKRNVKSFLEQMLLSSEIKHAESSF